MKRAMLGAVFVLAAIGIAAWYLMEHPSLPPHVYQDIIRECKLPGSKAAYFECDDTNRRCACLTEEQAKARGL